METKGKMYACLSVVLVNLQQFVNLSKRRIYDNVLSNLVPKRKLD